MLLGADVQELERLATAIGRVGQELATSHRSIDGALAGTAWTGPDASRFRTSWTNDKGALRRLSSSLEELTRQLQRNAQEQVRASSLQGMSGATGGGSHPMSRLFDAIASGGVDIARMAASVGMAPIALVEALNRARMAEAGMFTAGGSPLSDLVRLGGGASGDFGANGGHFELWGRAGLGAEMAASTDLGPGTLAAQAQAFLGAEGYAVGDIAWGEDGIFATLEAGGFVGARADASASYSIPGIGSAGVNASAAAGLGAWVDGDASVSWDEVDLSLDLGLVLGIGGEIGFDLEFSPAEIYDDAVDAIDDFVDDVGDVVDDALDDATDAIGDAAKAVGDLFSW